MGARSRSRDQGFSPDAALQVLARRLRPIEIARYAAGTPEHRDVEAAGGLSLALLHLGSHRKAPGRGCQGCGLALAIRELVWFLSDRDARPYVDEFVNSIDEGLEAIDRLRKAFEGYVAAAKVHARRIRHVPAVLVPRTLWLGSFISFDDVLYMTRIALELGRERAQSDLLGLPRPTRRTKGRPRMALREQVIDHLKSGGFGLKEISEMLALAGFTPGKEVVRKSIHRSRRRKRRRQVRASRDGKK